MTPSEAFVTFLSVGLAGGVGAAGRYLLGFWGEKFPLGILLANSLGGFFAGIALSFFGWGTLGFYVLAIGLAGGLSTFSTFAAQTVELIATRRRIKAVANISLNLVLPSTAVLVGSLVATLLLK